MYAHNQPELFFMETVSLLFQFTSFKIDYDVQKTIQNVVLSFVCAITELTTDIHQDIELNQNKIFNTYNATASRVQYN